MRIGAVFVLYNPNIELTKKSINSIANQVDNVFVIDNGSFNVNLVSKMMSNIDNLSFYKMNYNSGTAHALNVGIDKAISNNCDFVITCDQDSIFPLDFLNKLKLYINEYGNYSNVAAFSASFVDEISSSTSPAMIKRWPSYRFINQKETYCKVLGAISSGMIINTHCYLKIGKMNEDLFIDWVDFEWCFRANSKGYEIIKIRDLIFIHHLGKNSTRVLGKKTSIRSSERYYYITRNAFYIATHSNYLSFIFRCCLFIKGLTYIIGYTLINGNHLKNLVFCLNGGYDGIKGFMGRKK